MLYQERLCILDKVSSAERNCFITCNSRVWQLLWLLGIPDAALFILVFFTYPEKLWKSRVSNNTSWPKPHVNQHHRCSEVFVKEPTRSLFLLELWIFFCLIWLLSSSCRACCCAKGRLYRDIRTNRLEYPFLISIGLFCWFSIVESMFLEHSAAESCPIGQERRRFRSISLNLIHEWQGCVQYVLSIMRNHVFIIFSLIVSYRFPCLLYSTFVFAVFEGSLA